jgi:hydrogen peroxide-dependent heme synthase
MSGRSTGAAETVYAMYPCFKATRAFRGLDLDDAAQEVENLVKAWDEVTVRGVYSTVGFRADTDLMLWLVASSPDALQDAVVAFGRTRAGRELDVSWTFMGAVKPAEFTADHAPAFVKGEPPKRYLCAYPFVRTPEWYLLPPDERARLLREHGEIGREFPDVLANTTSAFGINDWEWILAFEADALDRIVDCIRRLRGAEARRFTKEEVPFVTGIRKDVRSAFADLA